MADALDYERRGRVTLIEQLLRHVDGALFTVRNMLGIDPDGGGVPDATETVKGKAELATVAEAVTGTDTTRIVTPAGLAAAIAASPPAATTRLRIQFTPHATTPTLAVLLNETALADNQFVAARASGGIYTITAASPIFDGQAMAWGGWVLQSGSDYGANVHKHSTTVVRVYTFNQGDGSFTDVTGVPVPVFVDIYA